VQTDPLNSEGLAEAYEGADFVVFGLNVDYANWDPFMVDALQATLDALAALKTSPTLLFPGNVYALGRQRGGPFPEDAPNNPCTRKGHLRNRMEDMLKSAAEAGQSILLLRLADFFGPTVRNGFVDRIFGNAAVGKPMVLIGRANTIHQMTYVPDAVRLSFDLLVGKQITGLTTVNAPTHNISSLSAFAAHAARSAGFRNLKQKKIPWFMIKMFGVFVPAFRELSELEYLFEDGVMLDDRRLKHLVPDFEMTPMDVAIRETLQSYRSPHSLASETA